MTKTHWLNEKVHCWVGEPTKDCPKPVLFFTRSDHDGSTSIAFDSSLDTAKELEELALEVKELWSRVAGGAVPH